MYDVLVVVVLFFSAFFRVFVGSKQENNVKSSAKCSGWANGPNKHTWGATRVSSLYPRPLPSVSLAPLLHRICARWRGQ